MEHSVDNKLFSHKEKYLGGLTSPGDSEKVEQKRVTETIVGGKRVFHTRQEIANSE